MKRPGVRLSMTATGLAAILSTGCGRIGFDLLVMDEGSGGAFDGGRPGAPPPPPDGAPASCALPCVNGTCDGDACVCDPGWSGEYCDASSPLGSGADGPATFDGVINLSRTSVVGRACADGGDAVAYSVTTLGARSATLATSPSAGCLEPGDAVLLSNRQGAPGRSANVGNYEFLLIESVSSDTVTFASDKTHSYGDAADDGIGTTPGTQRVVLQRVPQYSDVVIAQSASVTADPWDGVHGGVLALRANGELRLDGRVTMDGRGYRGGSATTDPGNSGSSGESIEGEDDGAPNGGGGGGAGDMGGPACTGFGLPGAGGGHRSAGDVPVVPACAASALATGGQAYGDALGARLFLGSGGGAGGASLSLSDNPPGGAGGNGGGIIILFAQSAVGLGTLSAVGTPGEGDTDGSECSGASVTDCWDRSGPGGGGAGGAILLRAATVGVGTVRVLGGAGGNGFDDEAGDGGQGSAGYPIVAGLP